MVSVGGCSAAFAAPAKRTTRQRSSRRNRVRIFVSMCLPLLRGRQNNGDWPQMPKKCRTCLPIGARPMLKTLAVANYRSIRSLVMPLESLNLITGANGSGKSNLYRALRLLAEAAQGGIVSSLAREGGLSSTLWAGPETISRG